MRRRNDGMTLIEVMVALVFTGIAFTALALSQVTGFRVTRSSQEAAIAKDLAMYQVELFRGYGFEPFKLCPTFDPADNGYVGYPACAATEVSADYPAFDITWALTNHPEGTKLISPAALVEIKVVVEWTAASGVAKEYFLTSYLSCGDPGEAASTNVPCPTDSLLIP
jgi:prepilin-type N-terminal cleavage/methylation domain-containing protein